MGGGGGAKDIKGLTIFCFGDLLCRWVDYDSVRIEVWYMLFPSGTRGLCFLYRMFFLSLLFSTQCRHHPPLIHRESKIKKKKKKSPQYCTCTEYSSMFYFRGTP